MNKTKGIIAFIISLAVLAFAGYVIMFGIGDRGQAKYITQGLDLKGGVSITYQVAESDKSNLTADTLEKTRAKLEKRIAAFSTEATAGSPQVSIICCKSALLSESTGVPV